MLKFKNMPIHLYAKATRNHNLVWSLWSGQTKALITKFTKDWKEVKTEVITFKQYHPKWCSQQFMLTEEEYQRMDLEAKKTYASYIPGFIKNITSAIGVIYERK